jgi:hypothetical protein
MQLPQCYPSLACFVSDVYPNHVHRWMTQLRISSSTAKWNGLCRANVICGFSQTIQGFEGSAVPWGWVIKKSNTEKNGAFVRLPKFEGPFTGGWRCPNRRATVGHCKKRQRFIPGRHEHKSRKMSYVERNRGKVRGKGLASSCVSTLSVQHIRNPFPLPPLPSEQPQFVRALTLQGVKGVPQGYWPMLTPILPTVEKVFWMSFGW